MRDILKGFQSFMQQDGGGLLLPEMMLVLFAMGILLTDYLLEARDKYFNALMAMLGVMFSGICLWQLRGAAENGAMGFNRSLLVDPFFVFFGTIFLIATALVIILSVRYLQIEDENHGEYYALMLFATVGMMFMASGYDLVVQFLGLETMAISFYVLAGFLRRDKRSNESAVKYLLLGAFSSAILAYGFSILYGIGAMANLSSIGQSLPPRTNLDVIAVAVESRGHADLFVLLALATVAAGLFFKVAAVPFHQWAPDVYEGAPRRLGDADSGRGHCVPHGWELGGDHADECEAHAGLLLDFTRGLHFARNRGGRVEPSGIPDRHEGRGVLPLRLRIHDHWRVRCAHRAAAAGNHRR
jgi:NADH:ubiquinone oxidoreductase subunit 2 (subunit N)